MNVRLNEVYLFAASPADVEREREEGVRSVAEELNARVARERGLVLRVRTYRDVVPGAGRIEDVILDQIGRYDIFVGIMSRRFGTPTGAYESGTHEEFSQAYTQWKATGRPRVMFYFKRAPEPPPSTDEEVDQIGRVVRFRRELQGLALTADYEDYDRFVILLRSHLTEVVLRWGEAGLATAEKSEQSVMVPYWPEWMSARPESCSPGMRTETGLYRSANSSVKFLTISGRSIYSGEVEDTLREKGRSGFQVKLLLFDWNSRWVPAKMRDERRQSAEEIDLAREKACGIARQLLRLSSTTSLDLEVRLYREYPVWRCLIVDNSRAYLGYYPPNKRGYEGPMYIFDKEAEASLFYPLNQYFEKLWWSSGESLQLDDPRFELRPLEELEGSRN